MSSFGDVNLYDSLAFSSLIFLQRCLFYVCVFFNQQSFTDYENSILQNFINTKLITITALNILLSLETLPKIKESN